MESAMMMTCGLLVRLGSKPKDPEPRVTTNRIYAFVNELTCNVLLTSKAICSLEIGIVKQIASADS